MRIGDLKHMITLQAPTLTPDGMGGHKTTWADIATVWAAIWPVSANEQVKNMQVAGEITHRVRIRYRANIRPSWRVKFGDRYFNIVGPPVNTEMRNEWLDLVCKEAM